MSRWRDERNEQSLARLRRAMPAVFPAPVLAHALSRSLIPPTPRLAVESYWRSHPIRADRLARGLAALSGPPEGWIWRPGATRGDGVVGELPGAAGAFPREGLCVGPGRCCVCGQPVYRLGWHRDLWGDGRPNDNAGWHSACVTAWQLWTVPGEHVKPLKAAQQRRCAAHAASGLLRTAQVDHRLPLYRVWRDHRRSALARSSEVLGMAEPAGHQPRGSCREMRGRGRGTGANGRLDEPPVTVFARGFEGKEREKPLRGTRRLLPSLLERIGIDGLLQHGRVSNNRADGPFRGSVDF